MMYYVDYTIILFCLFQTGSTRQTRCSPFRCD